MLKKKNKYQCNINRKNMKLRKRSKQQHKKITNEKNRKIKETKTEVNYDDA